MPKVERSLLQIAHSAVHGVFYLVVAAAVSCFYFHTATADLSVIAASLDLGWMLLTIAAICAGPRGALPTKGFEELRPHRRVAHGASPR